MEGDTSRMQQVVAGCNAKQLLLWIDTSRACNRGRGRHPNRPREAVHCFLQGVAAAAPMRRRADTDYAFSDEFLAAL